MTALAHLPLSSSNPSRDHLIKQLKTRLLELRQRNPASVGIPYLSCSEARDIGETLIKIKDLSSWGEFSSLLPEIGLSQPEASITRRIARDWPLIKIRGYEKFRAAVAYRKLVQEQCDDI
jgi:hypothetical protein